jgi:hypothetical protein
MDRIKKIEIIGAVFGIIFGTLLHFIYQWFGENAIVGIFSAISESVWEHTKLIFFPILFFTIIEWRFVPDRKRLVMAKALESLVGIIFIIALFYTYTSAFGVSSYLPVDILSFMVAVLFGKYLSYRIITHRFIAGRSLPLVLSVAIVILILVCFISFTFNPPAIPLFEEHLSVEIE